MTAIRVPAVLTARWEALAPRERHLFTGALVLVALALVWWVALAPAMQTLRRAPALHQTLDAQVQQMLGLQAQARALQSQPAMRADDALRALESSVKQLLGANAQLSVIGDRATVTLRGVSAEALAQWLVQVRVNARAVPAEAHLNRRDLNNTAAWDGTLVLTLPAR